MAQPEDDLALLRRRGDCGRPPANEVSRESGQAPDRGAPLLHKLTPPAALQRRCCSVEPLPSHPCPCSPNLDQAMVTTRHAAAACPAAVEPAAPRRSRTVRRQREEEREQEEQERAWQELRRAEMRRWQRNIAAKRAELQERRTERAERKRAREALWVDYCNRQNEHIAAMHEDWEAPPPKPLPPPVGDPPLNKRRKVGGGWLGRFYCCWFACRGAAGALRASHMLPVGLHHTTTMPARGAPSLPAVLHATAGPAQDGRPVDCPLVSPPPLLQTQHWTAEEVEALEEYVEQVRGTDGRLQGWLKEGAGCRVNGDAGCRGLQDGV